MGMFDKLKGLSKNLNKEKLSEVAKTINSSGVKEKMSSAMESLKEKIDSAKTNNTSPADKPMMGQYLENIVDKGVSKVDGFSDTVVEKTMEYSDPEILKGKAINSDNKFVASTAAFLDASSTEGGMESAFTAAKEAYKDRKEKEAERKANEPKDNKKKYKNIAKGAMFVGSFLYTQAYEGADSGTALMHAFKKTKEVDDVFDKFGGNDSNENKSYNEEDEQSSSNESQIKAIAHYEYIGKGNYQGYHVDIPTVHGSGCPDREEAINAIMKDAGMSRDQAFALWQGASSSHWRRVSYTYVNNGKLGGTVKC